MKKSCIVFIFITIFFIILNIISIYAKDAGNIQISYGHITPLPDENGWKAGQGKPHNDSGPVSKKPIKDHSSDVTRGCFVIFVIVPCVLIVLYILYAIFKPNKTLL